MADPEGSEGPIGGQAEGPVLDFHDTESWLVPVGAGTDWPQPEPEPEPHSEAPGGRGDGCWLGWLADGAEMALSPRAQAGVPAGPTPGREGALGRPSDQAADDPAPPGQGWLTAAPPVAGRPPAQPGSPVGLAVGAVGRPLSQVDPPVWPGTDPPVWPGTDPPWPGTDPPVWPGADPPVVQGCLMVP